MKLNDVGEILEWYCGRTQILKNSFRVNEITGEQFDKMMWDSMERCRIEILRMHVDSAIKREKS